MKRALSAWLAAGTAWLAAGTAWLAAGTAWLAAGTAWLAAGTAWLAAGTAWLAIGTACSLAYPLGDEYTNGKDAGGVDAGEAGASRPEAGSEGGAVDAGADLPMLIYAAATGQTHIRRYEPTTTTWAEPVDGPNVPGDPIRFLVLRRSPVDGSRILGIYAATSAEPHRGTLHVYEWNGSSFVEAFVNSDFGDHAGYRPFDIAFTRSTGRAIVIYGGGEQGNPLMRIRDAKGWGAEHRAFPKAPTIDWYDYFDLATREGTDDVVLVYQSNLVQLGSTRLVGDAFGDVTILSNEGTADSQHVIAGAFEQKSGDFVAAWGEGAGLEWSVTPAGQAKMAPKTGAIDGLDTTARVVAAPQPGSDRIAFAMLEDVCGGKTCDDFTAMMWNGTSFDAFQILDGDITTPYDDVIAGAPSAIVWKDDDALTFYHRSAQGFRWGRWRKDAWRLEDDYEPAAAIGDKATFVPFYAGKDLLTLVQEKTGRLWAARYDGNGWVDTTNGVPLATDIATPTIHDGLGIHIAVDGP